LWGVSCGKSRFYAKKSYNDELSSVLINILDLKFLQKHTIGKASSKFNLYIVWLQTFIAFLEKYFYKFPINCLLNYVLL
jgi:hypothetical protein